MINSLSLEYKDYQKRLKDSLIIVKKVLGKEPFLVIKTFSSYPRITSDLDVVVKKKSLLKKIKIKAPLEIDPHYKISWTNSPEISNNFVWNNIKNYNYQGINLLVPNNQLDTLIRIAHIPFETGEIRQEELLHIFRQSKNIDWKILQKEVRKCGWPKTFKRMINLLNKIHCTLYDQPLMGKKCRQKLKKILYFPYQLPLFFLAQTVWEKRAFKKILGARYIIKDRLIK